MFEKWQFDEKKCWFHVLLCSPSENCVADIFLPSVSCSRGPHKLVGRLQYVVCRQQQLLHMHVKLGLSAMLELLCLVHAVYKVLPHRFKVYLVYKCSHMQCNVSIFLYSATYKKYWPRVFYSSFRANSPALNGRTIHLKCR